MQKISILYDACHAVLSTFDLDEVLSQILSILRDYFHMQNAAIWLVDTQTGELYLRKHFGAGKLGEMIRQKIGVGLVGSAAQLKRPVSAPDVASDPRYLMRVPSTRSELAIPLMVRDSVAGVLDLQSDEPNFFDQDTLDLLTLFSMQAAIALENARLYSLEQRHRRQLEAINAIARQTTAVVDLSKLLEKVCSLILERFPVDHVVILLLQENNLYVRAHHGRLTAAIREGFKLTPGSGLSARALASGKTVLENDVSKVAGYVPGFAETQSEMCVPLIYFGEKLGVLALESATHDAFDEGDMQGLESVADICAAAIQNAFYFEEAQQLAYRDGLTGVFNRRYFEMRIAEELERAQRHNFSASVVMLDIDQFKRINDEFGHLLGDEVLRQMAHIFSQQLRKGDLVCRYGGEEFALLLPQTTAENALEAAEKLRRAVEKWNFPGVPRSVTISAGVAEFPESGRSRDEVVSAADAALYSAKQSGRNCVINASQSRKSIV